MKEVVKYPRDRKKEGDEFIAKIKKAMVKVMKEVVEDEINDAIKEFGRRLQHQMVYTCATLAATQEAKYVNDGKTLVITFDVSDQ